MDVNSWSISRGTKALRPYLVGAITGAGKEASGSFHERRRTANITSRRMLRGPGRTCDQSGVDAAGYSRPVLRSNSGVRVGKAHRMVMIRHRPQLVAVENRGRFAYGIQQSKWRIAA